MASNRMSPNHREVVSAVNSVGGGQVYPTATNNRWDVNIGTSVVSQALKSASGTVSSMGDNTLVAAGANRLKVYAFSLSMISATAVTCVFQGGASGTELWRLVLQTPTGVSGGANLAISAPAWLFATAPATLLNLNLSAEVTVNYSVSYFDEV